VKSSHPGTDPKLPSFQHPLLKEHCDDLERAYDAWHCLKGNGDDVKRKYLPPEPAEPPEAYQGRLGRAVFPDFFRAGLEGFAGVLSRSEMKDPPPTFEANKDNVDLEGNSLEAFWLTVDPLCLRDGAVPIIVEMPDGQPTDGASEAAARRRPYLVSRTRATCLNWRTAVVGSVEVVTRCTFLEWAEVDSEDGDFGVKYEERYRVIEPGKWTLYRLVKRADGSMVMQEVSNGQYLDSNQKPLTICPVVWYSAEKAGFGQGALPLRQVVERCFQFFRKSSDLEEKTHKCAMPVPVEEGGLPPMPSQPVAPLVIGPNTVIRLQTGGKFYWSEPAATSLAEQRAQIKEVKELIDQQLLGFLTGESKIAKTATQSQLEGGRTQVSIRAMSERKKSVMQSIFAIWCLYTGEQLAVGAGLTVDENAFAAPLDSTAAKALMDLAGGEPLISQQSAVEMLQVGGFNRITTSAEDEMERINRERPMLGAPTPERDDMITPLDEELPAEDEG
jgi:hypothetical protein